MTGNQTHTDLWVLITGGSKRLGREFCLAFAQAGWNIICHYFESSEAAEETCKACRALNVKAHAVQADLSDTDALQSLIPMLAKKSIAPHTIINNASSFFPDQGLDADFDHLNRMWLINSAAPVHLSNMLAKQISQRADSGISQTHGKPCAVHVLDQKVFNLNPDYFSYTLSKLTLERAVKLQAQALSPHIRVMGLAPGLLYPSGPQSESNFQLASTINLNQAPINPKDVALAAVNMVNNPSINGTIISVDAGQHLLPLARDVMFVVDGNNGIPDFPTPHQKQDNNDSS